MKRFPAWVVLVFLITLLTGCGGGSSGSSSGGGGGDGSTPTVEPVSIGSIDGTSDIAADSVFKYVFSQAIDTSTVNSSTFFMVPADGASADLAKASFDSGTCDPANAIAATVSCSSTTECILTPATNLSGGTEYSICLTSTITYSNGQAFAGFTATFTTAGGGGGTTTTYTIGGSMTGLGNGEQVVLQNNGGNNLTVSANGSFVFSTTVADGGVYVVSVFEKPAAKTCTVSSGTGTVASENVTNVSVVCSVNTYTIGGSLTGLGAGEEVTLKNNDADDLTVGTDGSFVFLTPMAHGGGYAVTVSTHPTDKHCSVSNGSGTVAGANVTNVAVACSTLAAPDIAAIKTALGANNAYGMVPGLALGGITLPVCTKAAGAPLDYDVTYSMTGLPAWLSFNASTRGVSLNGVATVPDDAYTSSAVAYKCADSADPTTYASVSFTVNDLDQGGAVDGYEYANGYVPLVNGQGAILLDPSNVILYRGGTSDFNVPTSIIITAVGMNPTDATDDTADFDGDGLTNLAEILDGTNIFVASSDGTFASPVSYALGNSPTDITSGDFNGDGKLDLAVSISNGNVISGNVSILLGVGDGTFAAAVSYATGVRPEGITTGDFNSDGDLDLAVPNQIDDNVSILLGVGNGTFAPAVSYAVGIEPIGISTGDFNGDGKLDLAVTNYQSSTVSVLLGVGDGTFAPRVNLGAGNGPYSITTGDFNRDGKLDLATSNYASNSFAILLGVGDGTFAAADISFVGTSLRNLTTGDFNGDGDLDLAVARQLSSGDNVSIRLGDGDGNFAAAVSYAAGDKPEDIAAGDFNGDGDLDLAVANMGHDVAILFGVGDGTLSPAVSYAPGEVTPIGITTGDFNGDGKLDLAAIVLDSTVRILLND